jgi:hypothetical protein
MPLVVIYSLITKFRSTVIDPNVQEEKKIYVECRKELLEKDLDNKCTEDQENFGGTLEMVSN